MTSSLRLLAALGLALAASGCAAVSTDAPPASQGDVCAMFAERPHWRDATMASARKWGAPIAVQMAIMKQESSFRADARPPARSTLFGLVSYGRASSAYGYAQALDGTWDWYLKDTGRSSVTASRTDFADAADFVGWYMAKTREMTGLPMHDAENHYLAYHEGQGGFKKGTHRRKAWLLEVAKRVDRTADRYGAQLQACGGDATGSLEGGWFGGVGRVLGWFNPF